jgi:hypothetical protein
VSWLRRLGDRVRWDGTVGTPRSANAASSFHLFWDAPAGEWVGAEATLEIASPPEVPALYFWALQVSFVDQGRAGGGAHLGLQWYPPHPGSTAVNWGGYAPDGHELEGSRSALPSATGNVNTRDFPWRPGVGYRLAVTRVDAIDGDHRYAWRGEITDTTTGERVVVRDLFAAGSTIESPMVWSEVFAACDAPSAAVRWSALDLQASNGDRVPVTGVRVNYQAVSDGGCSTTNSSVDDGGFVQCTGVARRTAQGVRLSVGSGVD